MPALACGTIRTVRAIAIRTISPMPTPMTSVATELTLMGESSESAGRGALAAPGAAYPPIASAVTPASASAACAAARRASGTRYGEQLT